MRVSGRPAPLLVFSDDWGRHPSSSQHLIRELLPSREVVWVNTIGTRPPRFDLRTAQRVLEKLGHWSAGKVQPREMTHRSESAHRLSPRIVAPRMWPSFGNSTARRLNKALLTRALKPIIEGLEAPPVAITTVPIVADLVGTLPVSKWIYYCVDDFSVWPGYDGKTMGEMERDLAPHVSETVAVSETLMMHLKALGARPTLITHGVDLEQWKRADDKVTEDVPELAGLQGPLIVFWGVLDRRMDVEWVSALSRALQKNSVNGSIVMFGPQEDPDPKLMTLPSVAIRPAVAFNRLPLIARAAKVLVMPYGDMPATRAMQPLKLKEYLATGLPVVVRDLPATRLWADACDVCDSQERFIHSVVERLVNGIPASQVLARQRLAAESWRAKAMVLRELIDHPIGSSRGHTDFPASVVVGS